MTRDEIIRLALMGERSMKQRIQWAVDMEREECAKLCMGKWLEWVDGSPDKRLDMRNDAEDCAFAIRARGQV